MRASSRHPEHPVRDFPRTCCVTLFLVACLTGTGTHAATYSVGSPVAAGQCTHATVQAAVDAANTNPGADVIRITRSVSWTAQQISINSAQDTDLIGGFANCTSAAADGTRTILDGAGGLARPVLTIRGNGIFRLRNLTITGGDQAGNDNGGGIFYEGGGILDIADTTITANSANDGGGIYATGTTIEAEVVLGANVTISSNIARNSGGGMVSKSLETSIIGPGTALIFNEARGQSGGGYGGGLVVVSDQFKSYAYISSNGVGGIGVIYSNEAKYGGGIAVLVGGGSSQDAEALIYSTDPQQPVRINANRASVAGGGVYVREMDSNVAEVGSARLWRAAIIDNTAPDGAALYAEGTGTVYFLPFSGAASAPSGTPQNQIIGNFTANTGGAVLRTANGYLYLDRVEIRGNEGGRVLYATDTPVSSIKNSLIADNSATQELIRSADEGGGIFEMRHVTLAGNAIGAPHVLFVNHVFNFDRSLVAQPGKLTLAASPGTRNMEYVLTNDASLSGGALYLGDPRFIDPDNGDYHLRAGSFAIDYAPDNGGVDLVGVPHTTDMPIGGIMNRTADVGAYERPALQPMVLNSDFNADLRFWTGLSQSFWDGTTNASGPPGSGSVRIPPVSDPEGVGSPRVVGRSQCVYLPGPGRYHLNGWGKVTSTMFEINSVTLRWELRYGATGLNCEGGAYNLANTHVLAASNTWRRPATAAVIDVPVGTWQRNTSLTIKLDTAGNQMPPIGWFDGITLDIDADDTIFKNGFDAP